MTETENQRRIRKLEEENAAKTRQYELLEVDRKKLLAREKKCDQDIQVARKNANDAITAYQSCSAQLELLKQIYAVSRSELDSCQSELKQLKSICSLPSNIDTVIEDETVYLVRDGEKEKVWGPIHSEWMYVGVPLLNNPSSTLLVFMFESKKYRKNALIIKDSLNALSRTSETVITVEDFNEVRDLRWADERTIRIFLGGRSGTPKINQYSIRSDGYYHLTLDEYITLSTEPRKVSE